MAYLYSRSITIDHTQCGSSDSTDFPVVVTGTYSWLATVANGGKVESASGYDIIFTSDSAGLTTLTFERVFHHAATGQVEFWVKVPTLSHTTDTVVYIWYGNSAITTDQSSKTSVWSSNFQLVLHMGDGSVRDATDSSPNNNLPSYSNSGGTTAGKIGGATDSSSGNSTITTGVTGLPTGANPRTVSYWLNKTSTSVDVIYAYGALSTPNLFGCFVNNTVITFWGWNAGDIATTQSITLSTWTHIVWTYDGTTIGLYVNGAFVWSHADALSTSSSFSRISSNGGTVNFLTGQLDELRVVSSVRSADWLLAEYNNQNAPASFYTVGSESGSSPAGAQPMFFLLM